MTDFRGELLARFEWIGGHANMLGLFGDGRFLADTADALSEPFADAGITRVAGIEGRGFVLGTAVALRLGVGFIPIRKPGAIHPGPKARRMTEPDWRGARHELVVQRAALADDDRVLLVDDWAEVGSQATAARSLIEECGAAYAGLSLLVDQLDDEMRDRLRPVVAIVSHTELPPSA